MNICILVHSKTGTTLKFGKMIEDALRKKSHKVEFIQLETNQPVSMANQNQSNNFRIINLPSEKEFDAFLVGCPVWGFQPTPVVIAALKQLNKLSGKKFLPFVTQSFPFSFMGGKQAIAQMSSMAKNLGAVVLEGESVQRMCRNTQTLMKRAVENIISKF